MRKVALLLVLPASLAYAQQSQAPAPAPPAQQPPAASPDTPAQPPAQPATVAETASPEIVGPVASDLGISPGQAQAAAGTLFGLSKTKLSSADFAKVASAVPNMEGLLKAAPTPSKQSALDVIAGQAGAASGLGAVAGVASTLTKLGLKPEQIAKLAPTLIKAVQTKGGAEIAQLLATSLK